MIVVVVECKLAVVPVRSNFVASILTLAASKSTLEFKSNVVPSIVNVVLVMFADVPDKLIFVAAISVSALSMSTLELKSLSVAFDCNKEPVKCAFDSACNIALAVLFAINTKFELTTKFAATAAVP